MNLFEHFQSVRNLNYDALRNGLILPQVWLDLEAALEEACNRAGGRPVIPIEKGLAQFAYEAYAQHTGFKSLATGQPLPQWADLNHNIKEAWQATAMALAVGILSKLS